jgi:DNA-binding MarR family transcriptional regulator
MSTDDRPTPRPPPSLAGDTGYLLRQAFLRARAAGVPAMPPGRHPSELGLLVTVAAAGPLSQRQLGDLLGVNRSAMVKLADRLEADGLLRRDRDPADKRHYALSATADGKAAIAEMTRGAARGEAELTAALTPAERRRLVELLRRIVPDLVPGIPEDLTELSGFLIPRAHLRVRAQTAGALAELGLAPQQFGMLATLAAIQPCSQQRLAAALGVSGPAVVATMADLESGGLITRERNPDDRREYLLRLTPHGHQQLAAARAIVDQAQQRLARQLGAAGLGELNALLTKITTQPLPPG